MLNRTHWDILIIDDEPDVHDVTELSLKREHILNLPLKLHHLFSAKETVDFLRNNPRIARSAPLALIDVVMETEHAGLELCSTIRNELNILGMQLILRTGQPGQAPPRKVIDNYDISGYVTKVEATGERMYLVLRNAIETYYSHRSGLLIATWCNFIREKAGSGADVAGLWQWTLNEVEDVGPLDVGFEIGRHYCGTGTFKEKAAFDSVRDQIVDEARRLMQTRRQAMDPNLPSGFARVGEYFVIEAKVLRTGKVSTAIFQCKSMPGKHEAKLGTMWRMMLGALGEMLA